MPNSRGLISSLLAAARPMTETPYFEHFNEIDDPLERSARIDGMRNMGRIDPESGARLSRHAIGSELARSLPFPLGIPASYAATGLFEGGKAVGQAFPEAVKGSMWELDPTSSKLDAPGFFSRAFASQQGAVDEYGRQAKDYGEDVKNFFGGLKY